MLAIDPGIVREMREVELHALTADIALLTYRLDGPRPSRRSSVWQREGGHWRLRFHQGTPAVD